ncbi:hypothetical protein LP123_07395 [Moraxella bovis]|uniref:Uncharacterized protein n=1 Tax=Moraxella bovis TaxID=476 RepID=A0ABY6MD03_MORBO|nr:hypothetical protein [Moraxella bovis]UYZ69984.1 hypothetical protein LP089_07475 [Moraxella bovis]UZA04512.1 hypothetical protein LP092_07255 [Moraxella bovis]UZA04910.1 hypothetical protein LP099_06890 [Moraxella bovis]UZA05333.1 hypothetical protein LP099_09180 [Moraxella bovis]UZA12437.1 hypothetical protein LP123_05130 [Moraxella bovis]
MILFQRGNFKIGKRRGHFIGDPTLSNRADGDLLIIDLFFISILHFTPNIKLTNAIKRLVTDKLDFSWHVNVSTAKHIAGNKGMQKVKKGRKKNGSTTMICVKSTRRS